MVLLIVTFNFKLVIEYSERENEIEIEIEKLERAESLFSRDDITSGNILKKTDTKFH